MVKINYFYITSLISIISVFVFIGSFKKNKKIVEKFSLNILTDEEKSFVNELKNTEYSKILDLVKNKNMTKSKIDKLIKKLSEEKDKTEPVYEVPDKTYL